MPKQLPLRELLSFETSASTCTILRETALSVPAMWQDFSPCQKDILTAG
jgi:hypothetical protein